MASFSNQELNTTWRKVASTIYRKPLDSKIYGTVEVDVTQLEEYIARKRKEGLKITLTHILTLMVGRAFRNEVPEMNAFIRRGNVVHHKKINAMVSVLRADKQMGSVKVENTDILTLQEISAILSKKIPKSRKGAENKNMQKKDLLSGIPWPFRSWFFLFYRILTVKLGISIPIKGINPSDFGSYVVSNIGSLGLDQGYGALLPSANVSLILIIGSVTKKPVVVDDQIVIRKILLLSVTLDHRVVDASHGGKLFRFLKYMIQNPQLLEKSPRINSQ